MDLHDIVLHNIRSKKSRTNYTAGGAIEVLFDRRLIVQAAGSALSIRSDVARCRPSGRKPPGVGNNRRHRSTGGQKIEDLATELARIRLRHANPPSRVHALPIQISRLRKTGARPEPPENPGRFTTGCGCDPIYMFDLPRVSPDTWIVAVSVQFRNPPMRPVCRLRRDSVL